MAIMAELDELFDGSLDQKMDFLKETTNVNNDGIYRVDLKKVQDKKKGYRAVVRYLPNLTKEGRVGQSAIEKISHYVDIKNPRELSGYFDSAKNFGEKCALTDLYWSMKGSNNAILHEKAQKLKYQRKYYSYVLIVEDEQQPELVGKVMIMQYGKTIRDKIMAEKNGDITGVSCNVFDLAEGKDFVLIVKEIQTGDETYPDYKSSMFRPETHPLAVYSEEKKVFRTIPLNENGGVADNAKTIVRDFLLNREHNVEEFAPKRLTEEQQAKVTEISNFLTGKSTANYTPEAKPTTQDFEFEDNLTGGTEATTAPDEDEDDFFSGDF